MYNASTENRDKPKLDGSSTLYHPHCINNNNNGQQHAPSSHDTKYLTTNKYNLPLSTQTHNVQQPLLLKHLVSTQQPLIPTQNTVQKNIWSLDANTVTYNHQLTMFNNPFSPNKTHSIRISCPHQQYNQLATTPSPDSKYVTLHSSENSNNNLFCRCKIQYPTTIYPTGENIQ